MPPKQQWSCRFFSKDICYRVIYLPAETSEKNIREYWVPKRIITFPWLQRLVEGWVESLPAFAPDVPDGFLVALLNENAEKQQLPLNPHVGSWLLNSSGKFYGPALIMSWDAYR